MGPGAVVKLAHGYRFYVKDASEILTKLCKWHVVVHQQGGRGDVELAMTLRRRTSQ